MQEKLLDVPPPLQTVPVKRKKIGTTNWCQRVVVADSFLEGCEHYIKGVLYLKVNDPFLERSKFVHCLNVVSQMKNVKIVVISAFQDLLDNEGLDVWNEIMAKHINVIKTFSKRKPSTKFIVLGPSAQISDPEKASLCKEILTQLKIGFKGIGNIFIDDTFSETGKELQAEERRKEVFDTVLNCFVNEEIYQIQPKTECDPGVLPALSKPASSRPDFLTPSKLTTSITGFPSEPDLQGSPKSIASPENLAKSPDRFVEIYRSFLEFKSNFKLVK
jgi:hypothetical protein